MSPTRSFLRRLLARSRSARRAAGDAARRRATPGAPRFGHAPERRLIQGDRWAAERRGVLQDLVQFGPRTQPELARGWPVTRMQVGLLLARLEADGLVDRVPSLSPGTPRFGITGAGRSALGAIVDRASRAGDGEVAA